MAGNFFVSQQPPSLPERPAPEETKEPTTAELQATILQLKKDHQDAIQKQSKEADKKINQIVEQLALVRQTLDDKMAQQAQQQSQEPIDPWEAMFQQHNLNNTQTHQQSGTQAKEEDQVDPKDVEKIVQQTLAKAVQEGRQVQDEAVKKNNELMQRFEENEKDLHPHRDKVVALWNRFAQANPNQDMDERYEQVIATAREMFGTSTEQKAPAFPSGGQSKAGSGSHYHVNQVHADPAMMGLADLERQTEEQKRKELEDYAAARKAAQAKKMGFFATIRE